MWPALWMLGANIDEVSWPSCGEVDIMEMVGGGDGFDDTTHGTVHWDDGGYASHTGKKQLLVGNLSDEFHVYSIIWTSSSITWFFDDKQYNVINTAPAGLSEFRNNFFLFFNVAVGGIWPGYPDSSTQFPQEMKVDYVRVFQEVL
ncbi:MAG: glycoside hydrolase family 16 protein, partial [Cyclobacteriaceae bacterium]